MGRNDRLGVGSGSGQSNPLEGDYNLIPTREKGLYFRWPLLPTFFSSCGRGRTGPRDGGDGLSDHPPPGTGGRCVRLPPPGRGDGLSDHPPRDGVGMGWKEALAILAVRHLESRKYPQPYLQGERELEKDTVTKYAVQRYLIGIKKALHRQHRWVSAGYLARAKSVCCGR